MNAGPDPREPADRRNRRPAERWWEWIVELLFEIFCEFLPALLLRLVMLPFRMVALVVKAILD